MRTWILVILMAAVAGLPPSVEAQVLYGSLVGTIEDQTGAVVPQAPVSIVNTETGFRREGSSGERGDYLFPDIPAGTYEVKVTAAGFRPYVKTGVAVSINATVRVNVRLEVGPAAEAITVEGHAAQLQTDRSDVSVDIGRRVLQDLPVPGARNYQSLLKMVPGFTPPAPANSLAGNPAGALATVVNGTNTAVNNTRVDGVSNTYLWLPHLTAYVPPLESIEAVNVVSNSYDAEQGFVGGAVVNVIIKSGGNDFHGSLYEYNSNSFFKAKSFFTAADQGTPKSVWNQFGGVGSGPVIKNKLFFFGSFEGLRQREGSNTYATLPTSDQIAGNFSAYAVNIFDPSTGNSDGSGRSAFPNAQVPASRFSKISSTLLSWLPSTNLPGTTNNLFVSSPLAFNRNNYDIKLNWNASSRTTAFGRYSQFTYDMTDEHVLGKAGGTGVSGIFPGSDGGTVRSATIGLTHVLSPSFLLDAHLGYTRQVQLGHDNFYGTNVGSDVLGIPGTNGSDVRQSGFPYFAITGYTTIGNPVTSSPRFRWDNQYMYAANAAWTRGAHNLRWGVEIARQHMNRFQPQSGYGPRGGFNFTGGVTLLKGGAATTQYNSMAAFLLGLTSSYGKSTQILNPMTSRTWNDGLYFRDQWRVTRNLTVNLGIRWEYYPMTTRDHRGFDLYDPATNKVYLGGVGSVPDDLGLYSSKKLFAPRFGLAYRLGQKSVIRMGYGLSTNPNSLARQLFEAYPVVIAQSYSAANSYVAAGRIENGIPALPALDFGNGVIDMPSAVTTTTLSRNYRRGYIQSFNFTVQRDLPGGFSVQAAYVGTRSIRDALGRNANAALAINTGQTGRTLYKLFGRTADTTVYETAYTTANYNALQTKLDRRFAGGLLATVSYTFSKSLGYEPNFFNVPSESHRNRARLSHDRPHNLQVAAVYELPLGKGKRWAAERRLLAAVLGGWQVNGLLSSFSGTPFNVTDSTTLLNTPGNSQVADLVKPGVEKLGAVGRDTRFYDPYAFRPVTGTPRFGNMGLYALRGPGVVNLDAGVFRQFRLGERFSLQFRAESFNLTNTPHFSNPSAGVNQMVISGGEITSLGTFMSVTSVESTHPERKIRFGMRLSF